MDQLLDSLNEISHETFDPNELQNLGNENEFIRLGNNYFIESNAVLMLILGIRSTDGLRIHQAIIFGQMVRLHKLSIGFLDMTKDRKSELSSIFSRSIFETAINLMYLMKTNDPEIFDDYIEDSFHSRKDLLGLIEGNISARNGVVLPIEDRIKKSVAHFANSVGVDISEIKSRKQNKWTSSTFKNRTTEVGMGHLYLPAYAMLSDYVHGGVFDVISNHLSELDGKFEPKTDWSIYRPQMTTSLIIVFSELLHDVIDFLGLFSVRSEIFARLEQIESATRLLAQTHEDYLAKREWPRVN
jgi:hypothetical protein